VPSQKEAWFGEHDLAPPNTGARIIQEVGVGLLIQLPGPIG
jgi:hypothetical protein